jgi:hypothetical protein
MEVASKKFITRGIQAIGNNFDIEDSVLLVFDTASYARRKGISSEWLRKPKN